MTTPPLPDPEFFTRELLASKRRLDSLPPRPPELIDRISELCQEQFSIAVAEESTHLSTCSVLLHGDSLCLSAESGLVVEDAALQRQTTLCARASVPFGSGAIARHLLRARVALLGRERFCQRQARALIRGLAREEAAAIVHHQTRAPQSATYFSPLPYGRLVGRFIAKLAERDYARRASVLCAQTILAAHAAAATHLTIKNISFDDHFCLLHIRAGGILPGSSSHAYHVATQDALFDPRTFWKGRHMRLLARAMGPERFSQLIARRALRSLAHGEAEELAELGLPLPLGLIALSERLELVKAAGPSLRSPPRDNARL